MTSVYHLCEIRRVDKETAKGTSAARRFLRDEIKLNERLRDAHNEAIRKIGYNDKRKQRFHTNQYKLKNRKVDTKFKILTQGLHKGHLVTGPLAKQLFKAENAKNKARERLGL